MTQFRKAAAIADVTEGTILARVDIAVPPERVFRALTTEELTSWWGGDEYRVTKFAFDARPGGRWRSDGVGRTGDPFHVEGEVVELDPPRRLVQTWNASWDPGGPTTITYAIDATPTGSRVTVRHTGFAGRAPSCEGHAMGWQHVLGWLAGHVARDERKSFLIRLVAPRATFPADITAEERAMMGAHVVYWKGKIAEGSMIAFGPVADPKGVWGLGIVRARDEAELATLTAGDPVIAAARGFRYDVLTMPSLVY